MDIKDPFSFAKWINEELPNISREITPRKILKKQKLKNCITFIDHIDYTIWYMFIMNFYQKFYMYMKTGLLLLQRQLLHVVTKSDQKYININTSENYRRAM